MLGEGIKLALSERSDKDFNHYDTTTSGYDSIIL